VKQYQRVWWAQQHDLESVLPESFLEIWDDFNIYKFGRLETVSTSSRNAEKSCQIRTAKETN